MIESTSTTTVRVSLKKTEAKAKIPLKMNTIVTWMNRRGRPRQNTCLADERTTSILEIGE